MGISSSRDAPDGNTIQNEDNIPTTRNLKNQKVNEPTQNLVVGSIGGNNTLHISTIGDGKGGDIVPTVFKWEHGGRNVYIAGTFNNWEKQIPMHRSGNDFTYIHNLKRGKHAFKFVVDDEWRFDPDQPTIADVEGRINNFIDITDFTPYTGDDFFFDKSKERKIPDEEFKQNILDVEEYTKE
jgi:hypothetical protein